MKREPIYGIGDKVRIVKYGHLILSGDGCLDLSPHLIGQEGLVDEVTTVRGFAKAGFHKI